MVSGIFKMLGFELPSRVGCLNRRQDGHSAWSGGRLSDSAAPATQGGVVLETCPD